VEQSSQTRKLLRDPDFDIWSRFSRNRCNLVYMFWHLWKNLKTF